MNAAVSRILCGALLLWGAADRVSAGEISVGDPLERVYEVLGSPDGYMQIEDREWVYYDRGKITAREGVVESVSLVSQDEADRVRARDEADWRALQARRAARIREGEHIRNQVLADPQFLSLSAARRVAYWEAFQQQHPEVNIEGVYQAARREYQREQEQQRLAAAEQRRLMELEARVREAEQRARDAEYRAAGPRVNYYYPAPVVVRTQPVIVYPVTPVAHKVAYPGIRASYGYYTGGRTYGTWGGSTIRHRHVHQGYSVRVAF